MLHDPLLPPSAASIVFQEPRWYPVTINEIVDGDTVVVTIDRGHDQASIRQSIRLRLIDTAESESSDPRLNKLGTLAKQAIAACLPIGSQQVLLTYKTPKAKREEIEKFGRFQGDFVLSIAANARHSHLTSYLIHSRLAVKYRGQAKIKTLADHLANYQHHVDCGSFAHWQL